VAFANTVDDEASCPLGNGDGTANGFSTRRQHLNPTAVLMVVPTSVIALAEVAGEVNLD
jgi:hypothetical protein